MLPLLPADARSSDERQLLASLRSGDPLALVALYSRTVAAAHACARRLLSDPREVEALLAQVYRELWSQPPEVDECPEGWVRRRCFALGAAHLQAEGRTPAAASTAMLLPALSPAEATPERPAPADEVERRIAALPEGPRMALLRAFDAGIPSAQQRAWVTERADGQADPSQALAVALRELAGVQAAQAAQAPDDGSACAEPRLGDWVLGLLDVAEAEQVAEAVSQRAACASEAEQLRRGSNRLDAPPPEGDLSLRVIAAVLSGDGAGALQHRGSVQRPDSFPAGPPPLGATGLPERTSVVAGSPPEPAEPREAVMDVPGAGAQESQPQPAAEAPAGQEETSALPVSGGAARHFARTVLGMLLLLLGAAVGLYVGQAIVAAL